jgi:cathepsin L
MDLEALMGRAGMPSGAAREPIVVGLNPENAAPPLPQDLGPSRLEASELPDAAAGLQMAPDNMPAPGTRAARAFGAPPDVWRAELLDLDARLREKYGRPNSRLLPEGQRTLPAASATSFDWVRVLGLTPIHDQSVKPNCTAQAVVAALEWNWQLRNGAKTKPALSPQPILDRLKKRGSLSYGESLDELLLHGTAALTAYPYAGEPLPPREKVRMTHRIIGWGPVGAGNQPTVDEIKAALLKHGPLVTGVYATPAFHAYRGGVFAEDGRDIPADRPTNHAIVIVGWDDRRGGGCWHLQNSWGVQWGEGGGGMWIQYGSNNVGRYCFWLRAQANQYDLPADAHKLLDDGALPFPALH